MTEGYDSDIEVHQAFYLKETLMHSSGFQLRRRRMEFSFLSHWSSAK